MAEKASAKSYFLSHSSGDDAIVHELRKALADLGAPIAIDSREFHGGDPLEATIRRAIDRSSGVLVLISTRAKDSAWVARELKHALKLQAERGGSDAFPVMPMLLDGTTLGAFDGYFDGEPLHVTIRSTALDEAPHGILVALRLREPTDAAPRRAARRRAGRGTRARAHRPVGRHTPRRQPSRQRHRAAGARGIDRQPTGGARRAFQARGAARRDRG